jgi:hypothetical protein
MKTKAPLLETGRAQKEQTLQLFLPAATKREITLRAAESGETVRVIVLRALEAYGFHVPEDALVDRRKLR